jgi:hypothetical protein
VDGSHLVREAIRLGAVRIGVTMLTDEQKAMLVSALDESRVKQVPKGGRTADYLETYDIIDAANRIFGYDGWSFELIDVSPIHAATKDGEGRGVLFMAKGRLTIGPTVRVDVGTNDVSYQRDSGEASPDAFETAIKGATSDCLKRCFRTWGAQFGNALYDKQREKPRPQRPAPPAAKPATKERTVNDLMVWAMKEHKLAPKAVLEIYGVETQAEITDLKLAADRVKAYVAGKDMPSAE